MTDNWADKTDRDDKTSNIGHRNSVALGKVSFFMNISSGIISSTINTFMEATQLKATYIVLVRNLFEALSQFIKIIIGRRSDKLGNRKLFLVIGYGIMPIIKFGFFFSIYCMDIAYLASVIPNVGGIIYGSIQLTERFCDAIRDGVRDTLICDNISKKDRALALGWRRFMACIGSFIGGIFSWMFLRYFIKSEWITDNKLGIQYLFIVRGILEKLYLLAVIPTIASIYILWTRVVDTFHMKRELDLNYERKHNKNLFSIIIYISIGLALITIGIMHMLKKIHIPNTVLFSAAIIVAFFLIKSIYSVLVDTRKAFLQYNNTEERLHRMKTYLILLSIIFFLSTAKFSDAFILQYAKDHYISIIKLPLLFAIYYLQMAIISFGCSVLMSKYNSFYLMLTGFIALPIFNIMMTCGKSHGIYYIAFSTFIYSIHVSIMNCNILSIVSKTIPDQKLGATYIGLVGAVMGTAGLCTSGITWFIERVNLGNKILEFSRDYLPDFINRFFQLNFIPENTKYFVAIIPSIIGISIYLYYQKHLKKELI